MNDMILIWEQCEVVLEGMGCKCKCVEDICFI